MLFSSKEKVQPFLMYLNSRHENNNFSIEEENEGSFSFLDVKVSRENTKFVTNIYRKPTFSGVLSNFHSFIDVPYKYGLIYSLLYRYFRICSDWKKFHYEINKLKSIFSKNDYPSNVIDFCIKIFLNKLHHCKQSISTVPKKDIFLVLLFLGPTSLEIRTRLRILFSNKLPFYNLRIIFSSSCRLKTFFHFKDRIPKYLRSGLVYKFKCAGCIATYYGKTKRHFKVRACEHLGISPLTGKRVSSVFQSTAIKDHLLFCQHSPSLDDFSILCSESNDFKLTLMESILISRDKPSLNRTIQSMPLELF